MDPSKMTVKQLKEELSTRSIIMNKSNKKELVERLTEEIRRDGLAYKDRSNWEEVSLHGSQNDDLGSDDDINVKDDDVSIHEDIQKEDDTTLNQNTSKNSIFTFKDVEESLVRFSGGKKQNIRKWLKDLEESAKVIKWSNIQKLVYGKRLLTGAAKSFINVEKNVTTFDQFKDALITEFGRKINGALVHKELMSERMKKSETYREYLYRMMAIAEQAEIDLESTIQYVIDGIDDSETNKAILYGSSTLAEIKKRLDYYEAMKSRSRLDSTETVEKSIATLSVDSKIVLKQNRCYKCGGKNHEFKTCENEVKCFKCQKLGHISTYCTENVVLPVSSESDDSQVGRV